MNRLHHITRLDYERTHAWWVRFQRGPKGKRKTASKMFSDGKWGGKRKALAAALAWRDANASRHPALPRGGPNGSGRKPQPIGYSSVTAFLRSSHRSDGRVRETPVLLGRFKTGEGRFATLQLSVSKWGSMTRSKIDAWIRRQRKILRSKRR